MVEFDDPFTRAEGYRYKKEQGTVKASPLRFNGKLTGQANQRLMGLSDRLRHIPSSKT